MVKCSRINYLEQYFSLHVEFPRFLTAMTYRPLLITRKNIGETKNCDSIAVFMFSLSMVLLLNENDVKVTFRK